MNNITKFKNYKNIIYDFDGTIASILIEWRPRWHNEVGKLATQYGYKFGKDEIVTHYKLNDYMKVGGQELRDRINKFNDDFEIDNYQGCVPNVELIKFIKSTKANQYILTSQNRRLLTRLLNDLEIKDQFKKCVTRDDVFFIKPDPEGIKMILQDQGLKDFILLGDSDIDEKVAASAGIEFEYIQI